VQLTVRGFVGNVVTTLLYKNTEQNLIEAVFEFPIDDQSAVYYFEAKIEDRVIIAECQEKKQVLSQFAVEINRQFQMPNKSSPKSFGKSALLSLIAENALVHCMCYLAITENIDETHQ